MADLNADGQADIIWYHPDWPSAVWLMRGGHFSEVRSLSFPTQFGWIVGIGDFNSDHHPDLVIRHHWGGGAVAIYLLDSDLGYLGFHILYAADSEWWVVGAGDYDRDGLTDVVWQHADGRVTVWLMDGVAFREARSIYTGATEWKALAR